MISYISSFIKRPTVQSVEANPSGPEGPITSLPSEILKLICSNLDLPALGNMSSVSKKCEVLSSEDEVWKKFENEFEVKAPEIKIKNLPYIKEEIKTSITTLKRVNECIKKLIPDHEDFHCKLAKVLFDGNIHSIKKVSESDTQAIFEINLYKNRKVYFDNFAIYNMETTKKAHLIVIGAAHPMPFGPPLNPGFLFPSNDKNIIQMNHSYFKGSSPCNQIFVEANMIQAFVKDSIVMTLELGGSGWGQLNFINSVQSTVEWD